MFQMMFGQTLEVQVQTQFPSPYLSSWETQPNIITVTVTNPNPTAEFYYIKATLESDRLGVLFEGTTDPFQVLGGQTYLLDNTTIVDVNTGTLNTEVENQIRVTNLIPEGIYTLSLELFREGETVPIYGPVMETFYILGFDRIQLLQPSPEEVVLNESSLIFQWTPVVEGISSFSVRYHLSIFEILPGQIPFQVIQSAYPVYETDVINATELIYPVEAYGRLEKGRRYIWYVQAFNNNPGPNLNQPLGENEGRSEIWSFFYQQRTDEAVDLAGLDRLELISGVAYLKNLVAVAKTESDTEYRLDGAATLVIYYMGDSLEINCTISNLSFLKGTFFPPAFTGGEVEAEIPSGNMFPALSGLPIEFTEVTFSSVEGLRFSARFKIPGSDLFQEKELDGHFTLNTAGFSGVVQYDGDWNDPLFQYSHELFSVRISSLRIDIASLDVRADVQYQFFNKDSILNIPNVQFNYPSIVLNFAYSGSYPVPLIADVLDIRIKNITGFLSINALSGAIDFDLGLGADFRLPFTTNPAAYPEVSLRISRSDGLQVQNFDPHLSSNLAFNLDYIQFGIQSLALNSFTFSGGKIQFDLQMNASLNFGMIPNFQTPVVENIHIRHDGFSVGAQNFSNLGIPPITAAGFRLELKAFRVGEISFTWSSGFAGNWNFEADFDFSTPSLPSHFPDAIRTNIFHLHNIQLNSTIVNISIPSLTFPGNEAEIALGGGAAYIVRSLGGNLEIDFGNGGITPNSRLDLTGEMRLPSFMNCSGTQDVTGSVLHLNGQGDIHGTITNFVPDCPIHLGILTCTVTTSNLEFSVANGQQAVILDGQVTASVPGLGEGTTATANGSLRMNLLTGEILDASIILKNFVLNIPEDPAVLRFEISEAKLTRNGLQITGTNQLKVGQNTVGVVFDSLTINPVTMEVVSGEAHFTSNFAFLLGVDGGNLTWGVSQLLESMPDPNTIGLNLPENIGINANGMTISGNSVIHLNVFDQQLDSLQAQFSADFALQFKPFKVRSGQVDFYYGTNRIAYLDAGGIHFDLLQFGTQALPEKLPLPDTSIAYLLLKQGSSTLVDIATVPDGVQISSKPGTPVKLILPALQFGAPTAPELDIEFSIVVDPLHFQLKSGSIQADIPDGLESFDLSKLGFPISIKHLRYYKDGGVKKFRFSGLPALFGSTLSETDSLELILGEDGRFTGNWNLTLNKNVPIVGPDAPVTLGIKTLAGNFDFSFQSVTFALSSSSAIRLQKDEDYEDLVTFNLDISNTGFAIRDVTPSPELDSIPLDLGVAQIVFSDFTIPLLSYSTSAGWNFQFEFSAAFRFPSFGDFKLPPIEHVTLGKSGIHFPETSLSDLNLPQFNLGGFGLKITSFRVPEITVDIFQANIDFGNLANIRFDLELNMPQAASNSLPPQFASLGLSIIDAGFKKGVLIGNIELKNIADPGLAIPMGGATFFATKFGGRLFADSSSSNWTQQFEVTVNGKFQLPGDLFPCSAPQNLTADLYINSAGQISGSVANFLPSCPLNFGPVKLTVSSSSLQFSFADGQQSAVLAMAASVHLPAPTPGDSISASGNISLDLIRKKFISGQIAINQPFRLSLPMDGDVLVFTINSALLDKNGLNISGSQTLNLGPGMSVTAIFTNFTLELNPFKIAGGQVSFASSFAFKVEIEDGELIWKATQQNPTISGDFGIALNLPDTLGISNGNFYANGTATVNLQYGGDSYNAITAKFRDGFQLQFKPLKVKEGKVEFINNNEVIAYIDSTGFVPGNVLGALPLPDSIGVPSVDIAYIKLKDTNGQLLVETTTTTDSYLLQIKPGKTLKLRIPGLIYGGDVPEITISTLSLGINKTTFQPVSGSIVVEAPNNGELLDLSARGLPLKLTKFQLKKVNGNYTVLLGAKIKLPESLGNMPLTLDSLALSAGGITGMVTLGQYNQYYNPSTTYLEALSLTGQVPIEFKVSGIQASFSSGSYQIRFSGDMLVDLLKEEGQPPAPIHFAADVGTDSTTFNIDISHLPQGIPLQIARLKALANNTNIPPIKVRTQGNSFGIELNTLMEIPSFGSGFAVEIKGLKIFNDLGLQFPTVTFNNPSEYLNFQLFAMQFKIDNLGFFYETKNSKKVFGLVMGGSLTLMENTSTFSGLKIGSDGSFSIQSASLISNPLVIVPNILSVQSLVFQNDSLRASFNVQPPKPLDQSPSTIYVKIAPNGTVSGGGQVALVNEPQGTGGGDATEWTFWKGTLDLTYLVLNLDFGNVNTSNIQFISDLWVGSNGGRIELGYKNGGQVYPGLQIDFDGDVTFANYRLQGTVQFDMEVLKFTLTNLTPVPGSSFGVSISGGVELDLPNASSSIQFANLEITKEGGMPNIGSSITGGDLTIGNIFSFSVSAFVYAPGGGDVDVSMGTMPSKNGNTVNDATMSSQTIHADSYVEFGVSMSIGSSFSGGVDRFLLFKVNGNPNIIIQNLHLSIQDVISGSIDLKYMSAGSDFSFLGAGEFTFHDQFGLSLVALFERENSNLRFGMFVAVELSGPGIVVFPGISIIKLGGGFFYNPRPEYLDIVISKTDLAGNPKLTELPSVQQLKFAAFLYAGISIVDKGMFEATTLITITDQYIDLAGKAIILNQGDKLSGSFKFTALFTSFHMSGYLEVQAKMGVVEGSGVIDFKMADEDPVPTWYVKGTVNGHIINESFLKANIKFFVGNPGFMVKVENSTSFNFWIVKVSSSVSGMVWMRWQQPLEFGAFMQFKAEAEVLLGLASIEAYVKAILIVSDRFILYGEAGGKVCVAWGLKCWDGSIWVKISNKDPKFSGGFGSDPEMAAKIAAAENMANEMENAANQAQQDLINKLIQATQLSPENIKQAGLNLYAADPATITASWITMEKNNGGLNASQENTLNNYRNAYIVLTGDLATRSQQLATLINQEKQFLQQAEQMAEAISNRIAEGTQDLPSVDEMLGGYAFDSPIQFASDSVKVVVYTDESGNEHATFEVKPQLQIDDAKVEQHQERASQMEAAQERILNQIYQRILAMNNNLKKIDFILLGQQGGISINEMARRFQQAHEKLEEYYMEKQELLFDLGSFASSRAAGISSMHPSVNNLITGKSDNISNVETARNLAKGRIRALMELLHLGNPDQAQKAIDSLSSNVDALENIADIRKVCNTLGKQLWIDIPYSGLTQLAQSTDTAVVNNIANRYQSVGALEERQVQITKVIDEIYDMRINYAQALYDLCDRYLYWQLGAVPPAEVVVIGNNLTDNPKGNMVDYIKSTLYPNFSVANLPIQTTGNTSYQMMNIVENIHFPSTNQNTGSGTGGMGIIQNITSATTFKGIMDLGLFTQPKPPVFVKTMGEFMTKVHLDVEVLRSQLAKQLSAPLITGITVQSYRNPHSGKMVATFDASHPSGIANFAYAITDAYTIPGGGGTGAIQGIQNLVPDIFPYSGPNAFTEISLSDPQIQFGNITTSTNLNSPGGRNVGSAQSLEFLQGMILESARQDYGVYSSAFKLIGYQKTLTSYFLPTEPSEKSHQYALKIRARSAGGFVNRRLANFTVRFDGTQRNQLTGNYSMLTDNTPPRVLKVLIPRFQYALDRIYDIAVEAVDYESDVIEVAYTVSENPSLVNPDSVQWKTVYARTEFNAMDLTLEHNHSYYVYVKVKNSVGLWSAPLRSNPVRIDTTSPGAPAITFTSNLPSDIPKIIPQIAVMDYNKVSRTINLKTKGDANFQFVLSESQQPEQKSDPDGKEFFPLIKLYLTLNLANQDTIPPGIRVRFDAASDAESGIAQYVYKVTGSPVDQNPYSGWRILGVNDNGTPRQEVVIVGEPLAYLDTFYVHIRAMNRAGLLGPAVTSIGIRPKDPTKPGTPSVHFGDGNTSSVLYSPSLNELILGFTPTNDNESGIREYQVRIGTTPGGNEILDWTGENISLYHSAQPLGEITPPENLFSTGGGSTGTSPFTTRGGVNGTSMGGFGLMNQLQYTKPNRIRISGLNLTNGTNVYVSVRAVNGDGVPGDAAQSGKIIIDNTPPSNPVISYSYNNTDKILSVTVSNMIDPESGVARVKLGVRSKNSPSPKYQEIFAGPTQIGRGTTNESETYYFYLNIMPGTFRYPDEFEIKAVLVNRANLKSELVTSTARIGTIVNIGTIKTNTQTTGGWPNLGTMNK